MVLEYHGSILWSHDEVIRITGVVLSYTFHATRCAGTSSQAGTIINVVA